MQWISRTCHWYDICCPLHSQHCSRTFLTFIFWQMSWPHSFVPCSLLPEFGESLITRMAEWNAIARLTSFVVSMMCVHFMITALKFRRKFEKKILSLLDRYQLSNAGNYFTDDILHFCWVMHCLGAEKAILLNTFCWGWLTWIVNDGAPFIWLAVSLSKKTWTRMMKVLSYLCCDTNK